jgi:hypothetical protein
VDGDGDEDVVTALDAHGHGVAWYGTTRAYSRGTSSSVERPWPQCRHDRAFSQPHALVVADIDGDGVRIS